MVGFELTNSESKQFRWGHTTDKVTNVERIDGKLIGFHWRLDGRSLVDLGFIFWECSPAYFEDQ